MRRVGEELDMASNLSQRRAAPERLQSRRIDRHKTATGNESLTSLGLSY